MEHKHGSIASAFHGLDIPSYDVLVNCMHCGLCLPTCPTYALTGLEKSSPRGRIRLIKSVADGDLSITPGFIDEMNFCLDCQACETACPAGVKYGSLVEAARAQISDQGRETLSRRMSKRILLDWLFRKQSRLKMLARGLRLYEGFGLKRLVSRSGLLKVISNKLHRLQPLSPTISDQFSSDTLPEIIRPKGRPRFRVGFLTGCIMDVAYADVNLDTIKLLLYHDCEVVIPKGQACCGSLQAHNGERSAARRMAHANVDIWGSANVDFIVMNSAGCGAFMKEYGHLFKDDRDIAEKAATISLKTKDITEFLVETGFKGDKQSDTDWLKGKRVTYHDACHLVHSQRISRQPRELLQAISGIEFIELPESTWCCGSAGIYNIDRYDDSMRFLERKITNIKKIRPDIIVTGNPGCLLQMQHGLEREGMNIQLMHTATFLRRACAL